MQPRANAVVVLAGGTGGAKLARGMLDVVGDDLVVVSNTGDDLEIYGAHVSPDPDLCTFWLADRVDERGWGLAGDTFAVMDGLRELGVDVWFNLGDRDLAFGVRRAELLAAGARLTEALDELGHALGLRARVPTARLFAPVIYALFVVMALMFIGGASGSTAGGIKVNTFSVLLVAILSTARGRPSAEAFGRRIPHILIYRALSVALLSLAVLFLVALGLELTASGRSFVEVLFESVSALGTVGASTGITPDLPDASQAILILAMFVGRLGPLTLVLALTARARPIAYRPAVETLRIG